MRDFHDCGADAAAYALGALDEAEARRYREHAADCVVCRDEIATFAQVTDALAIAVPAQPLPRGLRRRVLASARASTPVAPVPVAPAPPRPRRASAARVRRPALAAGLLVAVLAIAGTLMLTRPGAPTARAIHASISVKQPAASASVRLAGGHAELIVRRLAHPPVGQIYQVWLQRLHRAATPTGTLWTTGNGDVVIPDNLDRTTQLLVTQEPAGGSEAPTSPPVVVAKLMRK